MRRKDQIRCGSGFLRRLWVVLCSKVANLYEKSQEDYEGHISQLSDEELVNYFEDGQMNYRTEAIAFARKTLQSRGLSDAEITRLKKQAEAHAKGAEFGRCNVCGQEASGKFFKIHYGNVVRAGLVSLSGKNIYSDRSYYSGGGSSGWTETYYDITGETGVFVCGSCFEKEKGKHRRLPADLGTQMAIQLTRTEREKLGQDYVFSPQDLAALHKMTPGEISQLEHRCLDQAMKDWAEGKGPHP